VKKQTIDISLNWAQAVEICIRVLEAGTEEGKRIARAELRRMGKILDRTHPVAKDGTEFQ
jgi:hypothetical protein